jgi:hypothetical protein
MWARTKWCPHFHIPKSNSEDNQIILQKNCCTIDFLSPRLNFFRADPVVSYRSMHYQRGPSVYTFHY